MGKKASSTLAAVVVIAIAGCGGGGDSSKFTQSSIRTGFVKPADLGGSGIIEFQDDGVAGHIIYTPEDSVPTCPYAQRADDAPQGTTAAVQLQGGNSTGRWIVGPNQPKRGAPPVVTQGAVVFQSAQLADAGMKQVNAAAAKCPGTFSILGGPPQILGTYTVTSRPLELNGWKGFSQQLAHNSPADVNPDTYDDLVTVVLHKDNAILYAGFAQIKNSGERADSGAKAEQVMKKSLSRLD
ncbi:hypothetical protein [Solirubrobacter soli]|uniref:hypothetical protein n=1 Tax=Solirubrobacter soli TaxID=363832 RepID=UPI0012FA7AAA|nr:hypothetical protein [Solirubrobacter soli]